jgi:hypothetical protein
MVGDALKTLKKMYDDGGVECESSSCLMACASGLTLLDLMIWMPFGTQCSVIAHEFAMNLRHFIQFAVGILYSLRPV